MTLKVIYIVENAIEVAQITSLNELSKSGMDYRLVGGFGVALIQLAFPTAREIDRGTLDIDAALDLELAASGKVHKRLTEWGYTSDTGNRYRRGDSVIDFLVPGDAVTMRKVTLGGRGFDSSSSVGLSMMTKYIPLEVCAVIAGNPQTVSMQVRLASLESLVAMKVAALSSRLEEKDLIDLHNLLNIADRYLHAPAMRELLGGWKLDSGRLIGRRRDAARQITKLANSSILHGLEKYGVSKFEFERLLKANVQPIQ